MIGGARAVADRHQMSSLSSRARDDPADHGWSTI
jgi:hypothetical protein